MDPPLRPLPPASSFSPSVLSFLNSKLSTKEDLDGSPTLLSELRTECNGLDQALSDLNKHLQNCLTDYASHSDQLKRLFSNVNSQLTDLRASTESLSPSDGGSARVLGEELPLLAKEVARIETVRGYAENGLKLDTLVGDIEDAVSSTVNRTLMRHSSTNNIEEMRIFAIKTLKETETILSSITKTHPQWKRLISAVDHRIDRSLAILRPQAIADHRALLSRLSWPPSLSTNKKSNDVLNPLLTVQGELKHQYFDSFLSLCSLQEIQTRRKYRQLQGYNCQISISDPLWAIEELVNPISIASQKHFTKWIDKPEFIFALVYKIIRDYIDSMDELLQPLIDEAMLSGYSCREEWISGMVISLTTYLAKEIFPKYCENIEEDKSLNTSWLHLVDLMMAFDKKIQTLISSSGLDNLQKKISSLSVFCDRPDWLELWAEIELNEVVNKLESELINENNWLIKVDSDHKTPIICNVFLKNISSLIERCRLLPTVSLRSRFINLTCVPIINKYLNCSIMRCQEAEGLTALTDDNGLTKVSSSINGVSYFESIVKEWCEDVFFLEMEEDLFDKEVRKLEKFKLEWVEKLSTVILRGFDANCREYFKNRKIWQSEEEYGVSRSFVNALDYLQVKMLILENDLNKIDFVMVWRNLANGIDKLILNGILISNVKFSGSGIERVSNDFNVLYGVFGNWCLRPEGFFPRISEGLKLLKMEKRNVENGLVLGENWLKENGMRHLSLVDAERILKNRIS